MRNLFEEDEHGTLTVPFSATPLKDPSPQEVIEHAVNHGTWKRNNCIVDATLDVRNLTLPVRMLIRKIRQGTKFVQIGFRNGRNISAERWDERHNVAWQDHTQGKKQKAASKPLTPPEVTVPTPQKPDPAPAPKEPTPTPTPTPNVDPKTEPTVMPAPTPEVKAEAEVTPIPTPTPDPVPAAKTEPPAAGVPPVEPPKPPAPPSLDNQVRSAVANATGSNTTELVTPKRPWSKWGKWIGASAAVVVVLLVVGFFAVLGLIGIGFGIYESRQANEAQQQQAPLVNQPPVNSTPPPPSPLPGQFPAAGTGTPTSPPNGTGTAGDGTGTITIPPVLNPNGGRPEQPTTPAASTAAVHIGGAPVNLATNSVARTCSLQGQWEPGGGIRMAGCEARPRGGRMFLTFLVALPEGDTSAHELQFYGDGSAQDDAGEMRDLLSRDTRCQGKIDFHLTPGPAGTMRYVECSTNYRSDAQGTVGTYTIHFKLDRDSIPGTVIFNAPINK